MQCLGCGYCCKYLWVIIVDDPKKGIVEDNLKEHRGQGIECQHLIEEAPGKFICAIHDEPWYKKTPCFSHGQIEQNIEDVCRMGEYMLKQKRKKLTAVIQGKEKKEGD